jgi:hypothetical protein
MDPDAALAALREAFAILADGQGDTIEEDRAAYDAAQLAENLDNWLSNGGFLPTAWGGGSK